MKVYLVKMANNETKEEFFKIGCSSYHEIRHRFSKHEGIALSDCGLSKLEKVKRAFHGDRYVHPYDPTPIHEVTFERDHDAKVTEREVLDAVWPARVEPKLKFSGWTECFSATHEQLQLLIEYLDSVCASRNSAAEP